MRQLMMAAVMVLGLAGAAMAQTPATPEQAFAFDYRTTDIATYAVVRFEQAVDDGGWVSIGIPEVANDAQTPSGFTSYRVAIPALTPGAHAVTWRACNAQGCGQPATALPFVLVVQPPAPSGGRVVGE